MATSAISYLFVPASRPERFAKALDSSAHAVIVDLEDAISAEEKDLSLKLLLKAVEDGLSRPIHIRINSAETPWFERDLEALGQVAAASAGAVEGVIVPKVESQVELERVTEVFEGRRETIALIESAVGVSRAREIASTDGLTRFAVGAADLSSDLDVEIDSSTIDWVYASLVMESRLAGLAAPIASPSFEIRNLELVEREAIRLRNIGTTAQLCIHPDQVAPVHRGFLPAAEQVGWARRVIAAAENKDGAVQVDGRMVDKPIRERAERILGQVSAANGISSNWPPGAV